MVQVRSPAWELLRAEGAAKKKKKKTFQGQMRWEEVISDSMGDSSEGPKRSPPVKVGHGGGPERQSQH